MLIMVIEHILDIMYIKQPQIIICATISYHRSTGTKVVGRHHLKKKMTICTPACLALLTQHKKKE